MNELCYINNPRSLFRKYKQLVTWFANTKEGREYLNLRFSEHINLFLPNGYDKTEYENTYGRIGTFTVFPQAIYSKKLYFTLLKLDLACDRFPLSFSDLQTMLLIDLGYLGYSSDFPQVFLATATYNPNADPESTTFDGEASRSGVSESWATIRAGAGNASNDSRASVWLEAFANGGGTAWDSLRRCIFLFDTSAFSSANVLVSAKVTLRTGSIYAQGGLNNRLVGSTPASNTAVANSDYSQVGSTAYAADVAMTTGSTNYDFTLNATGETNLAIPQKLGAGITKHGLRFAKDIDNSEPGLGAAYDYGSDINSADSANDPALEITYTIPSGTAMFFSGGVTVT